MMKKSIVLLLTAFLLAAQVNHAYAQPGKAKKEVINGVEYYIHTVSRGETIYGISKMYKSTPEAIIEANPEAVKGLDVGDKLKIPVGSSKKENNSTKGENTEKQGTYDLYTVEKGETLYGLSKKFKLSQDKIIELNPDVKSGLTNGQTIRLPKGTLGGKAQDDTKNRVEQNDVKHNNIEPAENANTDVGLVEHLIQKGESLYGLSQKYKVSQDSIKLYNNGLPEGLKRGQTLVIPLSKNAAEQMGMHWYPDLRSIEVKNEENASRVRKEVYEVGLLLPFMLDKNQSLMESRNSSSAQELLEPTRQSLDFYHGVLLALDSLKKFGLNVNLRVYDTGRDSLKLAKILSETEFSGLDLIIGPTEMVETVAKFAAKHKIPMVCPFGYTNRILLDNEFVSKAVTSTSVMVSEASDYIIKNYSGENIILLDGRGKRDEGAVNAYRRNLNDELRKAGKDTVKYFKTDNISTKAWVDKLAKDKINVLVVPSNDLSFVSSFFNTLQGTSLKYNYKDYRFVVFGTEEWLKWDDIEANLKVKFSLHLPSPVYVSYTDTLRSVPFIKAFRAKFSSDPDKFAMMGFDLAWFYLAGYLQEGKTFAAHLENYDVEMVNTRFRYKKINQSSGYINTNVYLLKYEEYQLKIVN